MKNEDTTIIPSKLPQYKEAEIMFDCAPPVQSRDDEDTFVMFQVSGLNTQVSLYAATPNFLQI